MPRRHRKEESRSAYLFCWIFFFALAVFGFVLIITSLIEIGNLNKSVKRLQLNSEFPRIDLTNQMNQSSTNVFHIGNVRHPRNSNKRLEGRLYLTRFGDEESNKIEICFNPFGEGIIWKHGQDFILEHNNNQGLSKEFFYNSNMRAMFEWDSKLDFKLFGARDDVSNADGPDTNSPDGKNEIQFGIINENNVLAITVVWGIFDGPIQDREIFEADILYNLKFTWGNASEVTNVIDLPNIATHEIGHYIGTGHVGDADATMFPNAATDEVKKRDLLDCEIAGLCLLYNENKCPGLGGREIPPFTPFNGSPSYFTGWLLIYFIWINL